MKYENAIESLEDVVDFIKQQQTALEGAYSLRDLEAARIEVIKEIAERLYEKSHIALNENWKGDPKLVVTTEQIDTIIQEMLRKAMSRNEKIFN